MPKIDPETPPANGQEIKRLRFAKGFTQEELAAKTNMARKSLIGLERNGPATPFLIRALADFFGVPREQLINGKAAPDPPPVDNYEWFFVTVHREGEYKKTDAAAIAQELTNLLGAGVHVTRLQPGHSIEIVAQIDFRTLSNFLRALDTVFRYAYDAKFKALDFPISFVRRLSPDPISTVIQGVKYLSAAYPNLRIAPLPNGQITAKRRPRQRPAEQPINP